jgi:hypothetical protein
MNQVTEQDRDVSIGAITGKAKDQLPPVPVVVYFDGNCALCRTLAGFMGAKIDHNIMIFLPSEEQPAAQLAVEIEEIDGAKKRLSGEDAWAWILGHHPSLQELNWLAQKLGIARGTSKAMMATGDLLRRFCFRCR